MKSFNYIDVLSMKLIKSSLYDIFKHLEDKNFRKSNKLKVVTKIKPRLDVDPYTELNLFRIVQSPYDNHIENDFAMKISIYNWCNQYNTLAQLSSDDEIHNRNSAYVFNKEFFDNYDKIASEYDDINKIIHDSQFRERYPNFVEHYRQYGNLPIIEDLMANPLNYSIRTVSINFENLCNAFTYVMKPFLDEGRNNFWKNSELSWYEVNQTRHQCIGTYLIAITPIKVFSDTSKALSDIIRNSEFIGILCERKYMDYYHYDQNKYKIITRLHEYMSKLIGPKMEFDSLKVPYQE